MTRTADRAGIIEEHERLDRALYSVISELVDDEDVHAVSIELERCITEGEGIGGKGMRRYLGLAMDILAKIAGTHPIDGNDEQTILVSEAEKCVWAARVENYQELLRKLAAEGLLGRASSIPIP